MQITVVYVDQSQPPPSSGFYPYIWWVQLAPRENRGSFDKVVD